MVLAGADRRGLKKEQTAAAVAVVYIYFICNLHTSLHIAHYRSKQYYPTPTVPFFSPTEPSFFDIIKVETVHHSRRSTETTTSPLSILYK